MWQWVVDGRFILQQGDSFEQIAGEAGLMAGRKTCRSGKGFCR